MSVEQLNKRTILKISGPDTVNYLQSMITNDMKMIENSPAIYSLLLNSRGRVLYDILLYKINNNEYLVEYDKTAVEYLHKHLFMYRLRKSVEIQPINDFIPWVIYPVSEQNISECLTNLNSLGKSLSEQDGVIASVIDPRTNLLGVRVVTKKESNLKSMLDEKNFKFTDGNSYRIYRYKLGIGEGVIDHPTGGCLPQDTNVDFLNGVSFSKGCYIGQELTARLNFTMNIAKRLMPIVFEAMDNYPEFSAETSIINEKKEKVGRLRSNVGQFGLALLKHDECSKDNTLILKDYKIKLAASRPIWWPNVISN